MDMEWTERGRRQYLTQLAAIRVNEDWQTVDTFSTLFRPKWGVAPEWKHIAYTGWPRSAFAGVPGVHVALEDFLRWLQPEDTLCWWHWEARDVFNRVCYGTTRRESPCASAILRDRVAQFLSRSPASLGNPYRLCEERGIPAPGPAHCACNDAQAMRALLWGIGFPAEKLRRKVQRPAAAQVVTVDSAVQLCYDPAAQLLHRADCPVLPKNTMELFFSFKQPLRSRYRPCDCCRGDYYEALQARNRKTLTNCSYNYVYTNSSKVFHTRDCAHMLLSRSILGTGSYETCVQQGLRPCKDCRPAPGLRLPHPAKPAQPAPALSGPERSAIARFRRAKEERKALTRKPNLTEAEYSRGMALSQPGLAFWAERGCRNFHTRHCAKLNSLTELKGFPRYQDAVRAGYTPCRRCHPTAKQNADFSIPITNRERVGESAATLARLCRKHGLPHRYDEQCFELETAAGKWRVELTRRPVHLEHINLLIGQAKDYHVQPRLFLSLQDTFDYILRHDRSLLAQQGLSGEEIAAG